MKISWVNHASFVVQQGDVALICDPWLEGTAFNNGWSLISKTRFDFNDFDRISHIFFSHEHPDHFSPSNVRRTPQHARKNITVLFQETRDKRVVNFCKSLQFQTRELPEDQWVQISEDVSILCGKQGRIDSWLAIRSHGEVILNMNDCVFEFDSDLEHIAELVGVPDVLLTQFSFANWVGNPDDVDGHRLMAKHKLQEMRRQVKILRPRTLIPCASFVWFSHEENYFANKESNRIWDVYDFTTRELGIKTVVLYPGDEWEIGGDHDSAAALAQYKNDYSAFENSPVLGKSPTIGIEDLHAAHKTFLRKLFARNRNHQLLRAIPSSTFFITDLHLHATFSILGGVKVVEGSSVPADICLSSESLQYCLLYDWGGDTLAVNGRYSVPNGGRPERFFNLFRVQAYNSTGKEFDAALLLDIAKRWVGRKLNMPALQRSHR
ncbi:MAG: hypothetical protein JWO13_1784 [Acidobacteriales bacterium]|nr:hypothetical protein [Terriglobales bacterium]